MVPHERLATSAVRRADAQRSAGEAPRRCPEVIASVMVISSVLKSDDFFCESGLLLLRYCGERSRWIRQCTGLVFIKAIG